MLNKMWGIPKIWLNQTVILIGGGNSITDQFSIPKEIVQAVYEKKLHISVYSPFLSSIHNYPVLGVNVSFMLGDWVDVLFFGDKGFYKRYSKELAAFDGLKTTYAPRSVVRDENIKIIQRNPYKKEGLTLDIPNTVCWNYNSGAAAINLAVLLGAKRILLLGFDMKLDESNNQHFHKEYQTDLQKTKELFALHLKPFPQIQKDAEKAGIEIINCNPNSAIECFRKANIRDVL